MNTYLFTLGAGVEHECVAPVIYDPKDNLTIELSSHTTGTLYVNTNELTVWNVDEWDDIPVYTLPVMNLLIPCT